MFFPPYLASADRLSDDAISGPLIYQYMRKVAEPLYLKMTHGISNDIHWPGINDSTSTYHFSSQFTIRDTTYAISTAL